MHVECGCWYFIPPCVLLGQRGGGGVLGTCSSMPLLIDGSSATGSSHASRICFPARITGFLTSSASRRHLKTALDELQSVRRKRS